ARDVLQETCVGLYRRLDSYGPTKPFLAWAFRFAQLEVLKHRERNPRGTRLLSPELIERLAAEREPLEPVLQSRLLALEACLGELPTADRELVRRRYQGKAGAEELMRESGSSRRTLFRKLDRIRKALFQCISPPTPA